MLAMMKSRSLTREERNEFFWLAQAYNRIMPWHEFTYPVPHRSPPMHECSMRDTYADLKERRKACKAVGIVLELTFEI